MNLERTLANHAAWLRGEGGKRAFLTDADLRGADLSGANLTDAVLTRADLRGANLSGANLTDAVLTRANLTRAKLVGTCLAGAYLVDANLTNADLRDADLRATELARADLAGANLVGTCLDPAAPVPVISDEQARAVGLEPDGEWIYGYRSAVSVHVSETCYNVREEPYTANALSLDANTECHPGIYFASLDCASTVGGVVRVRARRDETVIVSRAKGARARRLWVISHA
jgi:hypothetical protein